MNLETIIQRNFNCNCARCLSLAVAATLLLRAVVSGQASEGFQVLHTFGTNTMGFYPEAALVPGQDGFLYGTAREGGLANRGQVFKVRPDGSGFQALKDFTGPDGAYPSAALLVNGTWLYGVAYYGGTNDFGTVFKLQTDGTGFTVMKYLQEQDGHNPIAKLVLSGNALYGTTCGGGTNDSGTVFRIDTDGTDFETLKYFAQESDGLNPWGGLAVAGERLYGTTCNGGNAEDTSGVLFALQTDGSGFTVLKRFMFPDGRGMQGDLLLSGSVLYGTAAAGGTNGAGTVFAMNTDGTGFVVQHHFAHDEQGAEPRAELTLEGSTLYGSTRGGGTSNYGVIYRVQTNGSAYAVLKDFADYVSDGGYPSGLLLSGTNLYGALAEGGKFGYGALFSLGKDGSGYSRFLDFAGGDGAAPVGLLALYNDALYGTTESGGVANLGTLFKIHTNGTGYAVLKEFADRTEGASPRSGPVLAGADLYGATMEGGSNGFGTIFRIGSSGEDYTVLHHFDNTNGAWPLGELTLSGPFLYGVTLVSSPGSDGLVFRLRTNGTGFTVLRRFDRPAEGNPNGGLVVSGDKIFGTTLDWADEHGLVYAMNTDGSGYVVLKEFNDPNGIGSYLRGDLLLSGTTLYGVAEGGGIGAYGTVFRVETDGTGFAVLKSFAWWDGAQPNAPLVLSGSTLYGTTTSGGAYELGTVFQVSTNGADFAVLQHLHAGSYPYAGLLRVVDDFYGTCVNGGFVDSGVLFRLSPGPASIDFVRPPLESYPYGSQVQLQVLASGYPPPVYQWSFAGRDIAGATTGDLSVYSVSGTNSGLYSLLVSNIYGSVSCSITVIVADPDIAAMSAIQAVNAGSAAVFTALIDGTRPLACQWFKGETALEDTERLVGTRTASLTISNVSLADEGSYHLAVSNLFGLARSDSASLTVIDPFIVSSPPHTNVLPGEAVSLTVLAGGSGPLSYAWLKNGQPLAGATSSTLVIPAAQASDAGVYNAIVTGGNRSAGATEAWLTVNLVLNDAPICRARPTRCLALQPDGKILVGGAFTPAPPLCDQGYLARLTPEGTLDTAFRPVLDGAVCSMALQPDGRLVIGGDFVAVNGSPALRLARIDPGGGKDPGFNASCSDTPLAMVVQADGKIVVGGAFTTVNYGYHPYIARLNSNGTLDESFVATANNVVSCLALQPDGKILAGGVFWQFNGSARTMLVRLNVDGTLDETFRVNPNSEILPNTTAVALQPDGKILIGGWWSDTSGQGGHPQLVRVNNNGSLDQAFRTSIAGEPYCFAFQPDGRVILGGAFTSVDGAPVRSLGRLKPDGTCDPTFNPHPNTNVRALLFQPDGRLLVGGEFFLINRQPQPGLARFILAEAPHALLTPAAQTVEAGTTASLRVRDSGIPSPEYHWFFKGTLLSGETNSVLRLPRVSSASAGAYSALASNVVDCSTSAPAVLSVVPPVPRRSVPAVASSAPGDASLQLQYAPEIATANWATLDAYVLPGTPVYYIDLTDPAPAQRYYRAWQPSPANPFALKGVFVPALTLTGTVGSSMQIDYINQVGPTNAWSALATVAMTNTTQLFFDVGAVSQPARLYRVTPSL